MGIKEDLKNLEPSKAAMIGLIIAVIYYFLFFNSGVSLDQQKMDIQNNMNQKTERLKQVANALNNKAAFEQEVNSLTNQLQELIRFFPADLDLNSVEYQIRKKLEESSNTLESMKRVDTKTHRFAGYTESSIELRSQGGFYGIMNFLSSLTTLDRVVDFNEIKMSVKEASDESSLINLQLKLNIFSQDEKLEKPSAAGAKVGG